MLAVVCRKGLFFGSWVGGFVGILNLVCCLELFCLVGFGRGFGVLVMCGWYSLLWAVLPVGGVALAQGAEIVGSVSGLVIYCSAVCYLGD